MRKSKLLEEIAQRLTEEEIPLNDIRNRFRGQYQDHNHTFEPKQQSIINEIYMALFLEKMMYGEHMNLSIINPPDDKLERKQNFNYVLSDNERIIAEYDSLIVAKKTPVIIETTNATNKTRLRNKIKSESIDAKTKALTKYFKNDVGFIFVVSLDMVEYTQKSPICEEFREKGGVITHIPIPAIEFWHMAEDLYAEVQQHLN